VCSISICRLSWSVLIRSISWFFFANWSFSPLTNPSKILKCDNEDSRVFFSPSLFCKSSSRRVSLCLRSSISVLSELILSVVGSSSSLLFLPSVVIESTVLLWMVAFWMKLCNFSSFSKQSCCSCSNWVCKSAFWASIFSISLILDPNIFNFWVNTSKCLSLSSSCLHNFSFSPKAWWSSCWAASRSPWFSWRFWRDSTVSNNVRYWPWASCMFSRKLSERLLSSSILLRSALSRFLSLSLSPLSESSNSPLTSARRWRWGAAWISWSKLFFNSLIVFSRIRISSSETIFRESNSSWDSSYFAIYSTSSSSLPFKSSEFSMTIFSIFSLHLLISSLIFFS